MSDDQGRDDQGRDDQGREGQDCGICNLVRGVSGTTVFTDDHWVLGMLDGLEAPGWMVLAQRRHAVGAVGMDAEEAASLGPLLKRAATAIEGATGAERVYVVAYGENAPHWHMLLIGRDADHPVDQRQAAIWEHRSAYIDPARARAVAAAVGRAMLDSSTDKLGAAVTG